MSDNAPQFVDPFAGMDTPGQDTTALQSLMHYAMPGRGKTTVLGSMVKVPGFEQGLIIDVDNGTRVLRNDPAIKLALDEGRLRILKVDKTKPAEAVAKIDYIIDQVTSQDLGYRFVGLDTLSYAQDAIEVVADAQFATSGKGGTRDGFAVWNMVGAKTVEWVAKLHNCPWLLGVINVHAKEQTTDQGQYRILPELGGSTKNKIGGDPDLVAYLDWMTGVDPANPDVPHLCAYLGKSPVYIAKNRDMLPDLIVDYDMPTLFRMLEQKDAYVDAAAQDAAVQAALTTPTAAPTPVAA
ncbi:AAA family ATPase [Agromyces sp. NPDC058104]|uniref:AAA family ATPase n=1 Tax=Agromyces sp. NPDC058104 TaxID=3346342 RepID=UPI0036DDEE51